jgi:alcohol dehydrogenase
MLVAERFAFSLGTHIVCQPGLARQIGTELKRFGRRVLLVTDDTTRLSGVLSEIEEVLADQIVVGATFVATAVRPTPLDVVPGVDLLRQHKADAIVAVGGSLVMDAAKLIRVGYAAQGVAEWLRDHNALRPLLPLIALPTTAGAGSEVLPFAQYYNANGERLRVKHPDLAPTMALLDPELLRPLPPLLTAATGMHALSHAIEAFASRRSNVISDSLALYAIDLIANYLRDATHAPDDADARAALLVGSCMAGIAVANASLGIVGALADAIGGENDFQLGALHSVLLPFGMEFNSEAVPNRYQRIGRALGIPGGGRAEIDVIGDSVTEVRSTAADCNLPLRLRDLGVDEAQLPRFVQQAATSDTLSDNPRVASSDDLLGILREAW